jgi:methionyl-tRNA formyltransferase
LDMPSEELWRKYRAYHGWPDIFFFDDADKRVKITEAHMDEDSFVIDTVIPEGKSEIPFTEWGS